MHNPGSGLLFLLLSGSVKIGRSATQVHKSSRQTASRPMECENATVVPWCFHRACDEPQLRVHLEHMEEPSRRDTVGDSHLWRKPAPVGISSHTTTRASHENPRLRSLVGGDVAPNSIDDWTLALEQDWLSDA